MTTCAVHGCLKRNPPVEVLLPSGGDHDVLAEVCVDHGCEIAPKAAAFIRRECGPSSLSSGVGVSAEVTGWRLHCPDLRFGRLELYPPGVPTEEPAL
jgi:hypothetical protein